MDRHTRVFKKLTAQREVVIDLSPVPRVNYGHLRGIWPPTTSPVAGPIDPASLTPAIDRAATQALSTSAVGRWSTEPEEEPAVG